MTGKFSFTKSFKKSVKTNKQIINGDDKAIQLKVVFRRAKIFPEENEYFMRLDEITHQLKIKFRDQEIVTPFSTPGLIPEWEFNLDFLLENLEETLDISICRKMEKEESIYEIIST